MLDASALSLPALLGLFVVAAVAVWIAGISLSNTTDVLADRLHLGSALGGLILLAVATNLPEIAITVSAALQHHLDIAIGNLLGGVAVQTVVLVLLDVASRRRGAPLMARAASLEPALEAGLVLAVLGVCIMGTQLPTTLVFHGFAPGATLVVLTWLIGVWLLGKARSGIPWQVKANGTPPPIPGEQAPGNQTSGNQTKEKPTSTGRAALVFTVAALVTLAGGLALEQTGEAIAGKIGLSGVLFGATVLAAATSLPEISTGLAAMRLGNDELAIGDIFGGNAFLPALFLPAALLSGTAVLPRAGRSDVYLAALGLLVTAVYLFGLIFRPRRRVLGMGVDSLAVLLLYLVGLLGLVAVARG